MNNWPEMMVKRVAASYCGLSVETFEREIAAGRLPMGVHFGGRYRWHKRPSSSWRTREGHANRMENVLRIAHGPGRSRYWHGKSNARLRANFAHSHAQTDSNRINAQRDRVKTGGRVWREAEAFLKGGGV